MFETTCPTARGEKSVHFMTTWSLDYRLMGNLFKGLVLSFRTIERHMFPNPPFFITFLSSKTLDDRNNVTNFELKKSFQDFLL